VKESLHKLMLLRVTNCEEESPYKPDPVVLANGSPSI